MARLTLPQLERHRFATAKSDASEFKKQCSDVFGARNHVAQEP